MELEELKYIRDKMAEKYSKEYLATNNEKLFFITGFNCAISALKEKIEKEISKKVLEHFRF
jgi:hypothetical protein